MKAQIRELIWRKYNLRVLRVDGVDLLQRNVCWDNWITERIIHLKELESLITQ